MSQTVQLGDIVKLRKGRKAREVIATEAGSALPYIQIDEVRGVAPTKYAKDPSAVDVSPNDLCIVWDGANAGTVGYGLYGAIGSTIARIRFNESEKWHAAFVGRLLQGKFRELNDQAQARGATIPHVDKSKLEQLNIPRVGLNEQRRIAAILDKADAIRRKREQALALADELLKSTFFDMFGSDERQYENLDDHLEFVTSGSRGWARYYSAEGSRFIRSLDVQMNYISEQEVVFVAPPKTAEAERAKVQLGDVLLTITGSRIGRVAPVSELRTTAYISQHVAIVRPKETLSHEFLAFYLSLEAGGQRQIEKLQYGQTKPGLNLHQIREFRIPVPSPDRQRAFVNILGSVNAFRTREKGWLEASDQLFASLSQRAFRGEL